MLCRAETRERKDEVRWGFNNDHQQRDNNTRREHLLALEGAHGGIYFEHSRILFMIFTLKF